MAKAQTRRAARAPTKAAARGSKNATPGSKLDQIVSALRKPKGATITTLMELTGWQMHSVRGAIAGAIKKKRGLVVKSEKVGDERTYRIGSKS